MRYLLIVETLDGLEACVNAQLDQGFVPLGGLVKTDHTSRDGEDMYVQAMIRADDTRTLEQQDDDWRRGAR